jgi:hypothetical protein
MDINQLAQQVAWLDEQHRRDRGELVTLQQRVDAQNTHILELTRKLQETEGRLASATAQLTRFSQVNQALEQLKEEVIIMLRREEEQRQLAEREASRIRLTERESHSKAINDLRQQVRSITKLQDNLELRKAEEQRLGELIMTLRESLLDVVRQTEGWSKSLSYLEEQRRQDNKRSAQLQQETAELLKRTESLRGRFEVTDNSLARVESRLGSLWNMRDEMKAEQMRAHESLLLSDEDRNRQFSSQMEQVRAEAAQMKEYVEQFGAFREQFEENKQYLTQLTQMEERLKRDQAQVAELQRLAEERMQKEYEEFQAENERRWRKHEVVWEHKWSEQDRANTQYKERFGGLEGQIKVLSIQINELWTSLQTTVRIQSIESERQLAEFSKAWEERTR